ncbi:ricin-type beta-trefoil lectin domain protein [Streptomyces pharetrae]|uniref:ricin-type beta-trefoil lectin domain protein n=1 Tax=Streptomyces pharetrae TaxID=291370 RepID=UPI00366A2391
MEPGHDHAGASDARLTELLRGATARAYPALRELRARHRESVLAYARLCAAGESTARQLAAHAFAVAAREAARGTGPVLPWRHRLLLLTARLAGEWATGERSAGLDPGLLLVQRMAGPGGPVPPLLGAFRSLPPRTRGLLWYAVVEREDDETTATLLGVSAQEVAHGRDAALTELGRACLETRLAVSDDPSCRAFRRLIEEAVRPPSPRPSRDLDAHRAVCAHCATAYEELSNLRDSPGTALAEGLLPWAGTAYATRAREVAVPVPAPPWPPSRRRLALASAALGAALAPLLLLLLLSPDDSGPEPVAGHRSPTGVPPLPAAPPPVTITATATRTVTPTPAASPPATSPPAATSAAPPRTPGPSRPPRPTRKPTPPPARPPGGSSAQVVNAASGLCLDIRDGVMDNGTDVVTAPCSAARTQIWRVDPWWGVLRSAADPEYCLDSRGSVDRGVGIWTCSSVTGRNGRNLRFTVDGHGVVRPEIAPDHAVTPAGGGSLALLPETGRADQRWRAGP